MMQGQVFVTEGPEKLAGRCSVITRKLEEKLAEIRERETADKKRWGGLGETEFFLGRPSFFHWCCNQRMYRVKSYQVIKNCGLHDHRIRLASQFICGCCGSHVKTAY